MSLAWTVSHGAKTIGASHGVVRRWPFWRHGLAPSQQPWTPCPLSTFVFSICKYLYVKKDKFQISLEDIVSATQNFSDDKCMEKGRYWKQYQAEILLANTNEHTIVAVKRFDSKSEEGRDRFLTEIKVLFKFKHKNIVDLVRICIDVATGLAFLHMVHSDIKSGSILLDAKWNAKISNLELASNVFTTRKSRTSDQDPQHLKFFFRVQVLIPGSSRAALCPGNNNSAQTQSLNYVVKEARRQDYHGEESQ
ncbi:kinase-like domain, phloem protein 2-like protein [Tanacetum coccineum]